MIGRPILGDSKSEINRKTWRIIGIIIIYHIKKVNEKIYTPTKPAKSSFKVEANEDTKFKLYKLKRVVESMKY